jgi:hypothetical protein
MSNKLKNVCDNQILSIITCMSAELRRDCKILNQFLKLTH